MTECNCDQSKELEAKLKVALDSAAGLCNALEYAIGTAGSAASSPGKLWIETATIKQLVFNHRARIADAKLGPDPEISPLGAQAQTVAEGSSEAVEGTAGGENPFEKLVEKWEAEVSALPAGMRAPVFQQCARELNAIAPRYDRLREEKELESRTVHVLQPITLREIQTSLPWSIRYSSDFRADPRPHKDFEHALIHVGKASGHLACLVDDMDHRREVADDPTLRERFGKYVADLVVCALRLSNVFPGGVLDLQRAVVDRIATKNAPAEPPEEP